METGVVKWFNDYKGFGFISRKHGPDVFVHHSAVTCQGERPLAEGEQVIFDIIKGPKGYQATNVRRA